MNFWMTHLADLYRHDTRTFTLFKIFSGISIFIGCLGLYGLITFMASQKLKEVGIRKVMGASVGSIIILFGKEFIKLILVAFLLAAPLAWYFMNEWLDQFAYRIPDFLDGFCDWDYFDPCHCDYYGELPVRTSSRVKPS